MAFDVLRTPEVRRVVEQDMDRAARRGYNAARDELRGRGCLAGGYRLAAVDGSDYPLCGRYLAYDWRLFTIYPDPRTIVIVAIDRHRTTHNPALALSDALGGLSPVGRRRRDKPSCCEDAAEPPPMTDELRAWLATVT
jgi:hypothetical protein